VTAVEIDGEKVVKNRLVSDVNPIVYGSQRSVYEVEASVGILKRNPLF